MSCHVATYAIPCCIWFFSGIGIGMSKYQPESARPRTSTLSPAILIRRASLSKFRITPIPPALWKQTNIDVIPRQLRWSLHLSSFMFVSWFVLFGTFIFANSFASIFLRFSSCSFFYVFVCIWFLLRRFGCRFIGCLIHWFLSLSSFKTLDKFTL